MLDQFDIRTDDMSTEMQSLRRAYRTGNRTIQLVQLDETAAREDASKLYGVAQTIEAFLERHLSDEEELAVPIILHHRLRG